MLKKIQLTSGNVTPRINANAGRNGGLCSLVNLILFPFSLLFHPSQLHPADLELQILHLWDNAPIQHESRATPVSFSRIAYLLSNPTLVDTTGQAYARADWYGYLDAASPANLPLHGLPDRSFKELRFSIGLDAQTNSTDPNQYPPRHPLNPVHNNLHWSWQGGYIFLALEGYRKQTGFTYHLGNAHNRMDIRIPVQLDLSRPTRLQLHFHLDQVFTDLDPTRTSTHGRKGDAFATKLKTAVENAFQVGTPQTLATLPKPKPSHKKPGIGTPYRFQVKSGFPLPQLPTDYPLTNERVALGEKLFNDPNLAADNKTSCKTCHLKAHAFAEPKPVSVGIDSGVGFRNSMPLHNMAWKKKFFWDGRATRLRDQALEAIESPGEMAANLDTLTDYLTTHPDYPALFESAFGNKLATPENVGIAIEQFVLTLTSMDSKFDHAQRGQAQLTPQEQRGFELFFTEYAPRRQLYGADCFHCHGGPFFSDFSFHHTGLPYTDGQKFATPSLRNLPLTAPYMHDGRFKTLEQVLDHYTSGLQRSPHLAPSLAKHRGNGIPLKPDDKAALIAFLGTLVDPKYRK